MTRLGEGVVGVDGNSRARRAGNKLDGSKLDGGEVDDGKVEDDEFKKKVQKTSKFKNLSESKKTVGS